jgi:antirestriction protein ArdC
MTKRDIYEQTTNRIIASLEAGVVPWHKPWIDVGGQARNLNSGRVYRGINPFLLALTSLAEGYTDPRWATFKGMKKKGGSIRKGEKGTRVIFWKLLDIKPKDDDEDDKGRKIPILRDYVVFNVEQAEWEDGVPALPEQDLNEELEFDVAAEAIVEGYVADGPELVIGGDDAYYSPHFDRVGLPELKQCEPYAKEELVAELGSAMLSGVVGLDVEKQQDAAYVANWLKALEDDHKLVVVAAAQAQKASDLILGTKFDTHGEVKREKVPA